MAAVSRQGVEAIESAAAEGAVSMDDAAALQRILEAVQDLCYYEPAGRPDCFKASKRSDCQMVQACESSA